MNEVPAFPAGEPEGESSPADATTLLARVRDAVDDVFLGQSEALEQTLAAFLASGHILLEGKPGLGKTLLVLALARTFGGDFKRIQFTPDLLPSDITGHTLYDLRSQTFHTRKGPVFTNLLLADEINRAPAKTQAALLEVMQEEQVTIEGETHRLSPPFMTLATQNPIEQEGTYPLPEAQLDRFLMKVLIDYPAEEEERAIVSAAAGTQGMPGVSELRPVCSVAEILAARKQCEAVMVDPEVLAYAVRIVRATRGFHGISLGAGTRGAISLVKVSKAHALLAGRNFVVPDDVKRAAIPCLRHRVTLAPELAISGQTIDEALLALLDSVDAPRM